MAWRALAAGVVGLVLACSSDPPPAPEGATSLRGDVWVQPLAPGIWRHVSYGRIPAGGLFPSNGVLVRGPRGALLVDTAWDSGQTALVLDWAQAHLGGVRALVVTHAHSDRLGGLAEVHRREIPSYALAATAERARQDAGAPPIRHALTSPFPLDGFGIAGEVFFPGPAHTADNATVFLAEAQALVGGCVVRAAEATGMGNTAEADLAGWPRAIAALEARYPGVRLVVPGHGEPGGPELLEHTRRLLGE